MIHHKALVGHYILHFDHKIKVADPSAQIMEREMVEREMVEPELLGPEMLEREMLEP